MSKAKKQSITWIDAAKGACIALVVLYHVVFFVLEPSDLYNTTGFAIWNTIVASLKPLRMPLFFIISGALAYSAIYSRSWKQTLGPRVYTMLWLYILWAMLLWLFRIVTLGDPDAPGSISQIGWALLEGHTTIWYLYALSLYFILVKFARNYLLSLVIGLAILECLSAQIFEKWYLVSMSENAVFFALGCYFRDSLFRWFSIFKWQRFLAASILSLGMLGAAAKFDIFYTPGFKLFLALVMVTAAIDMLLLICRWSRLSLLCALGKRTLPIYVLHMFFISTLGIISENAIIPQNLLEPLAISLPFLVTPLVIAACLTIHWMLDRGATRMLFALPDMRPKPNKSAMSVPEDPS